MGEERECMGELASSGVRADERVVEDNGLLGLGLGLGLDLGLVEEKVGGEVVIVRGVGVY